MTKLKIAEIDEMRIGDFQIIQHLQVATESMVRQLQNLRNTIAQEAQDNRISITLYEEFWYDVIERVSYLLGISLVELV